MGVPSSHFPSKVSHRASRSITSDEASGIGRCTEGEEVDKLVGVLAKAKLATHVTGLHGHMQ